MLAIDSPALNRPVRMNSGYQKPVSATKLTVSDVAWAMPTRPIRRASPGAILPSMSILGTLSVAPMARTRLHEALLNGRDRTQADQSAGEHDADGTLVGGWVGARREGQVQGLIAATHRDLDRLAEVALGGVAERLDGDGLAVEADDGVAGLQAGRRGRTVGGDVGDLYGAVWGDAWHADDVDHAEGDHGQQEVHAEPAARTMARMKPGLLAKLPGAVGSSSPSILTKAPKGIQLIE